MQKLNVVRSTGVKEGVKWSAIHTKLSTYRDTTHQYHSKPNTI